mgnify:CR=1 FL=1
MDLGCGIVCMFLEEPTFDAVQEDFTQYRIIAHSHNMLKPNMSDVQRVFNSFFADDRVVVDLKMDEGDPITISSNVEGSLAQCLRDLQYEIDVKDEDSIFNITVTVTKNINQARVSVYCFEKFVEYLNSLNLAGILTGFCEMLKGRENVNFILLDCDDEFFTDTLCFSNEPCQRPSSVVRQNVLDSANKVRYFLKASDYPFVPEDFMLKKRSQNAMINAIMDKLALVYSLVYLVDFSDITNNNTVKYRCCGYRAIEDSINYKNLDTGAALNMYKIYKWVYTDGNLIDKVGIARNVMTLYSNNHTLLDVTEKVYDSIKSNYAIYLKENLQQYIDIKNQITQLVYEMSQKANSVIDSFTDVFSNNIKWLITFYISVFVFNTLATGRLQIFFTRDIAYISFGILIVSLILLVISVRQLKLKESRFVEQYNDLKIYYADLLYKDDIERIFQYDQPHESNLEYINQMMWRYVIGWIIMIAIMGIITYILMP